MSSHYLQVGERRVHYRRSGTGPPLIILPAVPQSSAMVGPLMAGLFDRFTVIALDTPGYGESAALPVSQPEVSDYATALAETLDALHVQCVDIFAADTGAAVAVEFARTWPDRTQRLVLDRPLLQAGDERADWPTRYWPVIEPDDEGSHLTKAWGRMRDSYTFRPWFHRAIDARILRDLPSPLEFHHEIVDFLRAGVTYWQGPHAAWRYDIPAALAQITTPVTVLDTANRRDRFASRLGPSPSHVTFAELHDPDDPNTPQQVVALVRNALSGDPLPDAPPPPEVPVAPGVVRRDYVNSRAGQLLIRRVGSGRADGGGRPLVVSYGSLFSGAGSEESTIAWAADRPVIGFDIPGVGDSAPVPGSPTMADIAEAVTDGLDSLGINEFDLYGSHTSAMLAIELAIARPQQAKHVILDGITMFTDDQLEEKLPKYFQPLRITADGGYLAWAWHFVRDMYLWYPWYDYRKEHFRPDAMLKDTAGQHARLVDFLKGGLHFDNPYGAAMRFPTRTRLPLIRVPTLLCASPDDTLRPGLKEASTLLPHAIALETPGRKTPEARVATSGLFRQFLADEPVTAGLPV